MVARSEVKTVNDNLQQHEFYRDSSGGRQQEALRWAQAERLGRMASARSSTDGHRRSVRLIGVAAPMAAILGILAVLS